MRSDISIFIMSHSFRYCYKKKGCFWQPFSYFNGQFGAFNGHKSGFIGQTSHFNGYIHVHRLIEPLYDLFSSLRPGFLAVTGTILHDLFLSVH